MRFSLPKGEAARSRVGSVPTYTRARAYSPCSPMKPRARVRTPLATSPPARLLCCARLIADEHHSRTTSFLQPLNGCLLGGCLFFTSYAGLTWERKITGRWLIDLPIVVVLVWAGFVHGVYVPRGIHICGDAHDDDDQGAPRPLPTRSSKQLGQASGASTAIMRRDSARDSAEEKAGEEHADEANSVVNRLRFVILLGASGRRMRRLLLVLLLADVAFVLTVDSLAESHVRG